MMKNKLQLFLLVGALGTCSTLQAQSQSIGLPLEEQIKSLDTALFDAFNRCDDPSQLKRFNDLLADDLEFYHDKDGKSNKKKMLTNTQKNVCGKYRRELVENTLRIFPIGEGGAMEIGVHRFCTVADGVCQGQGEFLTIWKKTGTSWKAIRMLSYDHKALK